MIKLETIGRFANQLHEYAYARIMAEEMDLAFQFHKDNPQYKDIWLEYFPNMTDLDGKIYRGNPIKINDGHSGTKIKKLLSTLPTNRPIKLLGNFQNTNIYNDHQLNRIKEFLKPIQHIDPTCPNLNMYRFKNNKIEQIKSRAITDKDIVFHLRSGDMANFSKNNCPMHQFLEYSWLKQAIKDMKYNRLFIVTESNSLTDKLFGEVFLSQFSYLRPIYISNPNLIDDWNAIRLFKRIICSQSSFSFMAGLLSDAEEIYLCQSILGAWNKDSMPYRLPNDKRFKVIEEDMLGCIRRQDLIIKYIRRLL